MELQIVSNRNLEEKKILILENQSSHHDIITLINYFENFIIS